jgi:2-C-methyl-D-erythritol 4-phosphate cytidylyltransferase
MPGVEREEVWTIVVAAGTGARFGRPKQFELLAGRRVLDRSVDVADAVSDGVVVVVPAEHAAAERGVAGGATRSASVRRGLAEVPGSATIVCVHDAARPLATEALYHAVVAAVHDGADAAVPGVPVTDTVKEIDAAGWVVRTPERASLVAVQTPQAFRAEVLRRAHADEGEGTDDATLVERLGGRVRVVPGEATNRKLTHPDDLVWAEAQLARGLS